MTTTEFKGITKKEAIEKGWLSDKKIILKPLPRGGKMGTENPAHIAHFMMDGCTRSFCLPRNQRGDLINIFESDEERDFFAKTLGIKNLNISENGNFFEKFFVHVTKDDSLLSLGESFDMSDPMDNLRIRIVKLDRQVAPSWEARNDRPAEYRWVIIDESEKLKNAEKEYDSLMEFWKYMGKNDETPKKRQILSVYLNSINSSKKVAKDSSKQLLDLEFSGISKNKSDRELFLDIVTNDKFHAKLIVLDALECGAIIKDGLDTYSFKDSDVTYTFNEIANVVSDWKESQDDKYYILKDKIDKSK